MVVRFVIFIPVKKRAGGQKKTYWDLFGTSGTYLPYDIYIYCSHHGVCHMCALKIERTGANAASKVLKQRASNLQSCS